MLFDFEPGWHRWDLLHAHYQRAGSRHPRRLPLEHASGVGRQAIRTQAHPAAVLVLGSPGGRRRGCGALQHLPDRAPGRHEEVALVIRGALLLIVATVTVCCDAEEAITI